MIVMELCDHKYLDGWPNKIKGSPTKPSVVLHHMKLTMVDEILCKYVSQTFFSLRITNVQKYTDAM